MAFESRLLRDEPRRQLGLLDAQRPLGADVVVLCSLCKSLQAPDGSWMEIEDAAVELALFARPDWPRVIHSVCPRCQAALHVPPLQGAPC